MSDMLFSWLKNHRSRVNWLVVSTHLKNIRQNGNLPPNRGENKKYLKPPPRWRCFFFPWGISDFSGTSYEDIMLSWKGWKILKNGEVSAWGPFFFYSERLDVFLVFEVEKLWYLNKYLCKGQIVPCEVYWSRRVCDKSHSLTVYIIQKFSGSKDEVRIHQPVPSCQISSMPICFLRYQELLLRMFHLHASFALRRATLLSFPWFPYRPRAIWSEGHRMQELELIFTGLAARCVCCYMVPKIRVSC